MVRVPTNDGGNPMTIQRTVYTSPVAALVALIRRLMAYEERYQMTSADFYARYQNEEMGDSTDAVEWAGDYQHYLQLKEELVSLPRNSYTMVKPFKWTYAGKPLTS
jgi:hypothetical protein